MPVTLELRPLGGEESPCEITPIHVVGLLSSLAACSSRTRNHSQNAESLAGPPISFTEEAVSRGIDYVVVEGNWLSGFGCGVAFADLDNDGDPDIVLTGRADGRMGIYENNGIGHFADRTLDTDIILPSTVSGVVAGDYDGDGLLDLYMAKPGTVTYWGETGDSHLLIE